MTGLPYPTPTRLLLADAIAAGHVLHYHWINPWTCDTVRNAAVTARVEELVRAGLAEIPDPPDDLPESTVRLTPEGMAWVTRARTREPVSEEAMDAAVLAIFNDLAEPGTCRRAEWCVLPDDGHSAWECAAGSSTENGEPGVG